MCTVKSADCVVWIGGVRVRVRVTPGSDVMLRCKNRTKVGYKEQKVFVDYNRQRVPVNVQKKIAICYLHYCDTTTTTNTPINHCGAHQKLQPYVQWCICVAI